MTRRRRSTLRENGDLGKVRVYTENIYDKAEFKKVSEFSKVFYL